MAVFRRRQFSAEEAKRLKREIDRGDDPLDERKAARGAPTVKELAARYIEEHLPKLAKTSASDQIVMLERLVLTFFQKHLINGPTVPDTIPQFRQLGELRHQELLARKATLEHLPVDFRQNDVLKLAQVGVL